MAMADDLLKLANGFAPDLELKYTKFCIGLAADPTTLLPFARRRAASGPK